MNLARLPHIPGTVIDFYQEAFEHLGALCERSWYDRLQLVAEGRAARLWNDTGALHEAELWFPPPDDTAPRDAAREVFPGCPLTFRLAEQLLPSSLVLERGLLAGTDRKQPPSPEVAEKRWHAQWPDTGRWRLEAPFQPAHHFSLVALVRCEIQAIDQHWSLHRLAMALPQGQEDENLAGALDFAELSSDLPAELAWPGCDPAQIDAWLGGVLTEALGRELNAIRQRQENYLRRELDRIDQYFAGYGRELTDRASRSQSESVKLKLDERLAAARAEHARRRADQVQRHEIRVLPRVDALLLLAEPAWRATVVTTRHGTSRPQPALFVPRHRWWYQEAVTPPPSATTAESAP